MAKKIAKALESTANLAEHGETAVARPPEEQREPEVRLVRVFSPEGAPFWEKHPDHPKGEVWIAGHNGAKSAVVEVALTAAVQAALRSGRLEKE